MHHVAAFAGDKAEINLRQTVLALVCMRLKTLMCSVTMLLLPKITTLNLSPYFPYCVSGNLQSILEGKLYSNVQFGLISRLTLGFLYGALFQIEYLSSGSFHT